MPLYDYLHFVATQMEKMKDNPKETLRLATVLRDLLIEKIKEWGPR